MPRQNRVTSLKRLSLRDPENMFTVEYDEDEQQYFYNLLDTVNIDTQSFRGDLYVKHILVAGEDLYSVSQRVYNTPDLWWLIAEASSLECVCGDLTGVEILIPIPEVARRILETIDSQP
jgi:hypothetical protein